MTQNNRKKVKEFFMRVVLQRVKKASVTVEEKIVGEIDKGYLLFLGVSHTDTKEVLKKMMTKISKLRIFADAEGKTNLSIDQVDGNVLVISQFTLYADCKKGNRPSFTNAGGAEIAETLFLDSIEVLKELLGNDKVKAGVFGAEMDIALINNGPFTLVIDSEDL